CCARESEPEAVCLVGHRKVSHEAPVRHSSSFEDVAAFREPFAVSWNSSSRVSGEGPSPLCGFGAKWFLVIFCLPFPLRPRLSDHRCLVPSGLMYRAGMMAKDNNVELTIPPMVTIAKDWAISMLLEPRPSAMGVSAPMVEMAVMTMGRTRRRPPS